MRALKRERATTLSHPRQKPHFGRWRAIAGLLAVPFLSACSFGGSVNGATSVSPLLIGRWRQISIATADVSANCPASVSVGDGYTIYCGGNDLLEFNSDGTFTATFSGSNVQGVGTWRLARTKLLVFFTAPANVAGIEHSITVTFGNGGNNLIIKSSSDGVSTADTYARQ
jgi:hypothetical protein